MRFHILCVILISIAKISNCSKNKHVILYKAINDFCGKISGMLNISDVIFSPFSIYTALVLVELGSGGKTKVQIQDVLGYKWFTESYIYDGFRQLILMMNNNPYDYALRVANGVFINEDYMINGQYNKTLKHYFDADVKNVNFKESQSNEVINSWVSKKTNGMIKDMNSYLDPFIHMLLINAVYFKGQWETQFSKTETKNLPFFNGHESIYVDMMFIFGGNFSYLHHDTRQYLKLPYDGSKIYMLLALPDDKDAPANFIVNHDQLSHITFNMKSTFLDLVSIPKFKLEYEEEMSPILYDLGIKDLFSKRANLTYISEMNHISVSSVMHKAVIEVDEEGTTAAAITALTFDVSDNSDPSFNANHPFSFHIIDERTSIILFAGTVSNPEIFF